jgi:hypothetical protein
MVRLAASLTALITASLALSTWQAAAADDLMRGGFDDDADWVAGESGNDSLSFEAGLRYWYSLGQNTFSAGVGDATSNDTAHILEGHLRISDDFTRTYATALAGYTFAIQGTFAGPGGGSTLGSGYLGYAGADFGYMLLGDNANGIGPVAGYLFWNDALETSRQNFTVAESAADITFNTATGATAMPLDSEPNNLYINAAKLGLGAHVALGERVDITAQAAAIPFAKIQGTLGSAGPGAISFTPLGNIGTIASSAVELDGWGYGGSAEVMLGFEPIDNVRFRIGGRAMYVQGWADATYSIATISDPSDSDPLTAPNFDTPPTFNNQGVISTGNPFSMMRYGVLAELSYKF